MMRSAPMVSFFQYLPLALFLRPCSVVAGRLRGRTEEVARRASLAGADNNNHSQIKHPRSVHTSTLAQAYASYGRISRRKAGRVVFPRPAGSWRLPMIVRDARGTPRGLICLDDRPCSRPRHDALLAERGRARHGAELGLLPPARSSCDRKRRRMHPSQEDDC